ncbi:MAG: hypothetical protein K2G70_07650 [Turicibacter sp.]|nr:hypothetical protein [Turicibacter sp.]
MFGFLKRTKMNKKNFADWLTWDAYDHYFRYMLDIAVNVIKWENLPEGMDERYLEMSLIKNGYCYFFKDEIVDKYVSLSGANSGGFDVYGNPYNRCAIGVNGYRRMLNPYNSVICWNNYGRYGYIQDIEYFARRIANVIRTSDVNLEGQKTPRIYVVNKNTKLTMDNIEDNINHYLPTIKLDTNFNINDIKVLENTAPYIVDKLRLHFNDIWNEYLTFLGIENMLNDKKERMVADEVHANDGNIEASRNTMLSARKKAAIDFNKMCGTNMKPVFNSNLPTLLNNTFDIITYMNRKNVEDVEDVGGVKIE